MLKWLKRFGASLLERHPYGYWVGTQIVTRSTWLLPHEADFWGFRRLAVGRTGLFLDLGANLGHSALGFNKVSPGWSILSIEANPLHRESLSRVAGKIPGFSFKIFAIDRTSGAECTLHVPYFGKVAIHSAAATERAEAEAGIMDYLPNFAHRVDYRLVTSQTITVDDLDVEPTITKMDIQGKELDALVGAERTIKKCSPDFLVEVSMHPEPIVAGFRALGYSPFSYDAQADRFVAYTPGEQLLSRNLFFSTRAIDATSEMANAPLQAGDR